MKQKFFIVTTVPHTLLFFKGQIQILKKLFDVTLISSPGSKLNYMQELEKVPTHGLEIKRNISLINDLKSLYHLVLLFKKTKPHVVHGNTPKGGLLSMLAAFICRVPKRIYCIHGLRYQGNTGIKGSILKAMERFTCFLASDIVTVSFGVAKTLKKDSITKKKVSVLANGSINGINSEYFAPGSINSNSLKEEIGLKKGNLVFGFVGRLVKDKGTNELIEAFVKLSEKYSHIRLLLVGGEEENLDPLLPITKKHLVNHPYIKSVGIQEDIRPYLDLMDIFTFPSYREGFGVSIMEAASMGIPAISSDTTGCNEIIQDGYNGILIPPRSTDHLKNAMELLINNPELKNKLAAVTRPYILEKYDQQLVWNAVNDFYIKLM